jgi:hypothetical protein
MCRRCDDGDVQDHSALVAGKIRKWKGNLLGFDLNHLRRQLEASRDHIFAAAGIGQNVFGQ